jgi:hypothetical protein
MKVSKRGRFSTVVDGCGKPLSVALQAAVVVRPPHATGAAGDKVFMELGIAVPDQARVLAVDAFIQRHQPDDVYSPVRDSGRRVVVKVPAGKFAGAPLAEGGVLDASIRVGAFGPFGFCWLLDHVRNHEANNISVQSSTR